MRKRQGPQLAEQKSLRPFRETSNRYQLLEVCPHLALTAVTSEVLLLCTQVEVQDDLRWVGPVC